MGEPNLRPRLSLISRKRDIRLISTEINRPSKMPICAALYHEQLFSKVLTCVVTQFYMPPTRLSTSAMNHACLYSLATERHRILVGTHFPSR